jgi:hypothetical protein
MEGPIPILRWDTECQAKQFAHCHRWRNEAGIW